MFSSTKQSINQSCDLALNYTTNVLSEALPKNEALISWDKLFCSTIGVVKQDNKKWLAIV